MNGIFVTVDGVVGTEPQRRTARNGADMTSFRLVSKERRWDKASQNWVSGPESWMGVSCFQQLAGNVHASIRKGDRVLVHGRIRVAEWRDEEGRPRTSVQVEADAVGHSLQFGTTQYRANRPPLGADGGRDGEGDDGRSAGTVLADPDGDDEPDDDGAHQVDDDFGARLSGPVVGDPELARVLREMTGPSGLPTPVGA